MPSAEAAKRLRVVTFRASRYDAERWRALADAAGVPFGEWVRAVLDRERVRLERARLRGDHVGYGCVCDDGPKSGERCPVCGRLRLWSRYRAYQAAERTRQQRAAPREGVA